MSVKTKEVLFGAILLGSGRHLIFHLFNKQLSAYHSARLHSRSWVYGNSQERPSPCYDGTSFLGVGGRREGEVKGTSK